MTYFAKFPLLRYTSNNIQTITTDVLRRVSVNKNTRENLVIFDEYDIKDGETPESVSYKFYETSDYHWVILLVNDILDPRYDWPLNSNQLYEYTSGKYGSANVSAVHHYTISETNDLIVDPTQVLVKKEYAGYLFPENAPVLWGYAANGTIDSTLSDYDKTFINFIQSESDRPLPGSGVLYRGDFNHSFVNQSPGANLQLSISGVDAFPFVGTGAYNITDLNYLTGTFTNELDYSHLGPGYTIIPRPVEFGAQHIVYHIIKPLVDNNSVVNGNVILGSTGNLFQEYSDPGVSDDYFPNHTRYYKNGLYYTGRQASAFSTELNLLYNAASPINANLSAFLSEPVQNYYQRGDITGTTYLGGVQEWLHNDANVIYRYNNGMINSGDEHFANIVILLTEILANAQLSGGLVAAGPDPQTIARTLISTNTYPYANAFPVTNIAHESNINESKRRIRVLRPEYLSAFVTEFERLVNA